MLVENYIIKQQQQLRVENNIDKCCLSGTIAVLFSGDYKYQKMNSNIREYSDFINDIKDAIRNVEVFVKGIDFKEFSDDTLIQKAVIRCLEEIGEGVKHIPDEV